MYREVSPGSKRREKPTVQRQTRLHLLIACNSPLSLFRHQD